MEIKLALFNECDFCNELEIYAFKEIEDQKNIVKLGCNNYHICKSARKARERIEEKQREEGEE